MHDGNPVAERVFHGRQVAQWNGSTWSVLGGTADTFDGSVNAIAAAPDGECAGGSFFNRRGGSWLLPTPHRERGQHGPGLILA